MSLSLAISMWRELFGVHSFTHMVQLASLHVDENIANSLQTLSLRFHAASRCVKASVDAKMVQAVSSN